VTVRTATRLAWSLWGLLLVFLAASIALSVLNGSRGNLRVNVLFSVDFLAVAMIGALVASRRPENAIGWLFLGPMVLIGLVFVTDQYATLGLISRPDLPAGIWGAWVSHWLWAPPLILLLNFVPLLFPDGRPPTPRWRILAWGAGAFVLLVSVVFALDPDLEYLNGQVANPIGVEGLRGVADAIDAVGPIGFLGLAIASAISLGLRFRRATPEQRVQIKWFLLGVVSLVLYFVVTSVIDAFTGGSSGDTWPGQVAASLAILSLPAGAAVAILKYRLYDIDLVINRAVVYGALAGFITAVYVGVVVGIGSLVGRGDEPNLALSIAATTLVALAFQPVRSRVQHLANRLVYGKRAAPYEVLSRFAGRMAGATAIEEVLPRMARTLGEASGASSAMVWLRFGDELRPAAAWPEEAGSPLGPVRLSDGELPALPRASLGLPVSHGGELLGALAVSKAPGDRLTPTEEELASHLASQAGLVLRNARLAEDLRARLDELQASRKRLVATQDAERRSLERNLHDGAQQQLVALSVKVRLAQQLAASDRTAAARMVETLEKEARDAVETLRDLSRGIYPATLAHRGLATALEAQARTASVAVVVDGEGIGRFPQDVEAAAYFTVLEALQNVAKYADASSVVIRLRAEHGELRFEVKDDGRGFDVAAAKTGTGLQGMADRMDAVGGAVVVRSAPGMGTSIIGRIPVPEGVEGVA
jgi:signal transduction histidine kinase